jgi:putative tricarboxylic transport membrane protein
MFDVWVMLVFGVLGYFMKKGNYPTAGFLLALILGPTIENTFRQALIMSNGSYAIFYSSSISLALFIATILFLLYPLLKSLLSTKQRNIAQ